MLKHVRTKGYLDICRGAHVQVGGEEPQTVYMQLETKTVLFSTFPALVYSLHVHHFL